MHTTYTCVLQTIQRCQTSIVNFVIIFSLPSFVFVLVHILIRINTSVQRQCHQDAKSCNRCTVVSGCTAPSEIPSDGCVADTS